MEHRVGQSRFVNQFSNLSFAVGADQLGTLLKGSDVGSELTDSLRLLTHGEGVLGKTVFVAAHVFGCHHHDSINKPEVLLERVDFKSQDSLVDLNGGLENEHFFIGECNTIVLTKEVQPFIEAASKTVQNGLVLLFVEN